MQSKLFPAIVAGVALVAGVASSSPSARAAEVVPEAYGFADAQAYDVWDVAPALSGPSFSDTASVASNPLGRATPDASASAAAHGSAFGPFGVSLAVAANAANPTAGGSNRIEATASSANYVQYVVTSDSLPAGDPVRARLTLNLKGTIELVSGHGTLPQDGWFYAYLVTDSQIGQNGGPMDIVHEGGVDVDPDGLFLDGDFEGEGTLTHDVAAGRRAGTFDFTDIVEFDTAVGSTIEFSFNYWTEASSSGALNMSANVDFSAGTTYSLAPAASSSNAQFVAVVPEPAALSLAGLAACGLFIRRRPR